MFAHFGNKLRTQLNVSIHRVSCSRSIGIPEGGCCPIQQISIACKEERFGFRYAVEEVKRHPDLMKPRNLVRRAQIKQTDGTRLTRRPIDQTSTGPQNLHRSLRATKNVRFSPPFDASQAIPTFPQLSSTARGSADFRLVHSFSAERNTGERSLGSASTVVDGPRARDARILGKGTSPALAPREVRRSSVVD